MCTTLLRDNALGEMDAPAALDADIKAFSGKPLAARPASRAAGQAAFDPPGKASPKDPPAPKPKKPKTSHQLASAVA